MKKLFAFILLSASCFGQIITSTNRDTTVYASAYGTAANGTTDDRAAIQRALDAAETKAVASSAPVTVRLDQGKTYKVVVTAFTPTSGTVGYGGLAMPENVTLDLNGSTIIGYDLYTGSGDGALIFPKGLHTNTTDYGAASGWTVMNGRIKVRDRIIVGGATGVTTSSNTITSNAHGLRNGERVTMVIATTGLAPVTATAADDLLTYTAHGLADGTPVALYFNTSAGYGGLTSGTRYFVRDSAADTFKLSATSGGSAIDITTDGPGAQPGAQLRKTWGDVTVTGTYYVINATTNTFQISATYNGSAATVSGGAGFYSVDARVGNMLVFSQCENVTWKDLTIGQNYYHALEIQAGRNLLVENVTIDPQNILANGAPEIQFDVAGSAGFPKNSGFTHTPLTTNIVFRRVSLRGFPPSDNGAWRRVEFGHSAGVCRNIHIEDCYFDGLKGSALTSSAAALHAFDCNTSAAVAHVIDGLTLTNTVINHDCIHGSSGAFMASAGTIAKINNVLLDGCVIQGVFGEGISFGGFSISSPAATSPSNRTNMVARNCVVKMGHETTAGTAWDFRAQNAYAIPISGGTNVAYTACRCEDVTFDNCRAIMPTTFTNANLTLRGYYGFYMSNNTSTTLRNNSVRFTHTLGGSVPAAGYFYGGRGNIDGVITTDTRDARFVQDGFTVETANASNYRYCWDDDTVTSANAYRLSGYRRGVIFKSAGSSAGNENDLIWNLGEYRAIAGSTGNVTQNTMAGQVQFAAAATTLTVTNSLVHANSVITATVATNDTTMKTVAVVAGTGSFVLHANAAATGTTKVNWKIE
ncbi:MAG: hypothetical protein E6Q97_25055 [Desulfurellales bacterium]|nr:MAG: hypothetical protein E6Q97_25055 [Desulfurellales bacterium]